MTDIKSLTLNAPAKVNLWLTVTGKRPDGYHEIESVMQTVTLFDEITLTVADRATGQKISITCNNPDVPCDEKNLCYRAAIAYLDEAGIRDYNIKLHIEKRIPMAAGLAGGSTDGAAVLVGLNRIYGGGFSEDALCDIGKKLGADIPFCIKGGSCEAKGIGELLTPCMGLPPCYIVIACGGEGVSTPWAYGLIDENPKGFDAPSSVDAFLDILNRQDIREIAEGMKNSFEDVVIKSRPVSRDIRRVMEETGAIRAMMSGSGPSVFGIFTDKVAAETACERISASGCQAHICLPYYGEK